MIRKLTIIALITGWAAIAACASAAPSTPTPSPTPSASPTGTHTPPPTATGTPTPTQTHTPKPTSFLNEDPTLTPASSAGSSQSSEPITLRLQLQAGETYRIQLLTRQEVIQNLEGQQFETLQTLGIQYSYAVTEVDSEGNTWMDLLYERVILEQDTVLGQVEYDSADPPAEIPPEAQGIRALIGLGFSLRMSPRGEVLETRGAEELVEQMIAALQISDPAAREQMEATLRQQYGGEGLQNQLRDTVVQFPEEPLRVGDSWSTTTETFALTTLTVKATYTLRGFDEQTARIDVRSSFTTADSMEMLDFGLFQLGYVLAGDQEGTMLVNLQTGLSNIQLHQDLSGEMTIAAEGEQLTVPLTAQGVFQVRVVEQD